MHVLKPNSVIKFQNLEMARVQGDMLVRKFVVRITCLKDKTSRKNFMIKKSQTRSQFKTQFAYCPELVMFLASRRCSVLVKIIKVYSLFIFYST